MKSAILITVSLKSKRLKKKALKKIYGYELITLLIKRLKKSQFRKNIIICTSNKSFDDPLVSIAHKNEIKIYGTNNTQMHDKKVIVPNLGDHRICMSSFILSLITGAQTRIKNFETVFTSSPSFLKTMKKLGAKFEIQK